jgi:hypothetical protein
MNPRAHSVRFYYAACSAGTRWCQCCSTVSSSSVAQRYAQKRTGLGFGAPLRMTMPSGSDWVKGTLLTGNSLRLEVNLPSQKEAPFVPLGWRRQTYAVAWVATLDLDRRVGWTRLENCYGVSRGHTGLQSTTPSCLRLSAGRRFLFGSSSWIHPGYSPRRACGPIALHVGSKT